MKNYLSYKFLMPRVKRDTTIPKHMVLMEMGFMLHKLEEKAHVFSPDGVQMGSTN